jgi:hypothetical protein
MSGQEACQHETICGWAGPPHARGVFQWWCSHCGLIIASEVPEQVGQMVPEGLAARMDEYERELREHQLRYS